MNSPQFNRWRAFRRLFPPLELRLDVAAAMATAAARAIATGEYKPADFLRDYAAPYRDDEPDEQDEDAEAERVAAKLDRMFTLMAARAKAEQAAAAQK